MYIHNLIFIPFAVEALYKKPDVKIFKENSNAETEFALIEHKRIYHATWDPDILSANEFNEPAGNITFKVENWIFGIKANDWINRRENRNKLSTPFLELVNVTNIDKGTITFRQNTDQRARFKFDMSLLVLIKKTNNLEIYYSSSFLSFLPKPKAVSGKNVIAGYCQVWHRDTKEKLNSTRLSNCPCTLTSAMFDNDFQADPTCSSTKTDCHENIDASRCYLRKIQGMCVSVCNQILYYCNR